MTGRPLRAAVGPVERLTLLLAAVTVIAAVLGRSLESLLPGAPPWWVMVGAVAFAEATAVHLQTRRNAMTLCLSEIPLVIGLALVAPVALLAERLLGMVVIFVVVDRMSPRKIAFNLARAGVETVVAVTT